MWQRISLSMVRFRISHISKSSIQENNLYVNNTQPDLFIPEGLEAAGERGSSTHQFGFGDFVQSGLYFVWTFTENVPLVPRLKRSRQRP